MAALAHQGATGVVKMRMDLMVAVGDATETLGNMAKSGDIDPDAAATAAAALAAQAAQMPGAFETRDLSRPTEAREEIWDNWTDFTAKAEAMGRAAQAPALTSEDPAVFRQAIVALGRTCTSCHESYRLEK